MKMVFRLLILPNCLLANVGDLSPLLEKQLEKTKVPACAAAAIIDGRIVSSGVAGIRKKGEGEKVTMEDRFHLGSCTKSMTATLAAILVDEKKLKWNSTVGDVFPKIKIHDAYRKITLTQLLNHTSGTAKKVPPEIWKELRLEKRIADQTTSHTHQRGAHRKARSSAGKQV